jgi:hypothetical protein
MTRIEQQPALSNALHSRLFRRAFEWQAAHEPNDAEAPFEPATVAGRPTAGKDWQSPHLEKELTTRASHDRPTTSRVLRTMTPRVG